MKTAQLPRGKKFETEDLEVTEWHGVNLTDPHSELLPGELREAKNWDLYRRRVRTRRGSSKLTTGASGIAPSSPAIADIGFDVGATEHVIFQTEDGKVWSWELAASGIPKALVNKGGSTQLTLDATPATFRLSQGRLLIFHPLGNKIVEWDSGGAEFEHIPMGLPLPYINGFTNSAGSLTGQYYYGVELCYIDASGVEVMASTPSRYNTSGVLAKATLSAQQTQVGVSSTVLDANTVWTHIRLYRSRRVDLDLTDPTNVPALLGSAYELYPIQLMTKAAFIAASYKFAADNLADDALPGFVTTVGDFCGALYPLYTIDRMDQPPIPAGDFGEFVKEKMVVVGAASSVMYWSNFAGTRYAYQYDVQSQKGVEKGDGQQVLGLVNQGGDLVAFKEGKTLRLAGGDTALDFTTVDLKIGLKARGMASVVPGVGTVIVSNDGGRLYVLDDTMVYKQNLNDRNISEEIREFTSTLTSATCKFLNGKLWLLGGTNLVYVLHVAQRKGWTPYEYPVASIKAMTVFQAGQRGVILVPSEPMIEVEVNIDTDYDPEDDATVGISASLMTHRFASEGGENIVTHKWLSVKALLDRPLGCVAFSGGLPWPSGVAEVSVNAVPDPSIYDAAALLKRRVYKVYLAPPRMLGPDFHYRLTAVAPAEIEWLKLTAEISEGSADNFDPFLLFQAGNYLPAFGSELLVYLLFEADSARQRDVSGNARDHTWTAGSGGGTRVHLASFPPGGGESLVGGMGSGIIADNYNGMDFIGDAAGANSKSLTFVIVFQIDSLLADQTLAEGGNGQFYWRLSLLATGKLRFWLKTASKAWAFVTDAVVLQQGKKYLIAFVLTAAGDTGVFYCDEIIGSFAGARSVTRSALTGGPLYFADAAGGPGVDSSWTIEQLSGSPTIIQSGDHYQRAADAHNAMQLKYIQQTFVEVPRILQMNFSVHIQYTGSGYSTFTNPDCAGAFTNGVSGWAPQYLLVFDSFGFPTVTSRVYLVVRANGTNEFSQLLFTITGAPPFSTDFSGTLKVKQIAGNNVEVYWDGVLKFTTSSGKHDMAVLQQIKLSLYTPPDTNVYSTVKNISYVGDVPAAHAVLPASTGKVSQYYKQKGGISLDGAKRLFQRIKTLS